MINEALRLIRVFHDVKMKDLATELNMSISYLSEIENGKKKPSMDLINKYAKYFETTPAAILFFSDELKSREKKTIRFSLIKFMMTLEKFAKTANE